jgi:hypothetical protein
MEDISSTGGLAGGKGKILTSTEYVCFIRHPKVQCSYCSHRNAADLRRMLVDRIFAHEQPAGAERTIVASCVVLCVFGNSTTHDP